MKKIIIKYLKTKQWFIELVGGVIPIDAHLFEVFAIKDSEDSPTGKQAFIGYKLKNGNFHFIGVPYNDK